MLTTPPTLDYFVHHPLPQGNGQTFGDIFSGGGGSTTGMLQIPGIRGVFAANHWPVAVELHNANHPQMDHACVDLHQERPGYFPKTDILWASPECTKWSQSNSMPMPDIEEGLFADPNADDAATQSRLLMFDVLRFAEHHRYRVMVVENVVDIATQEKYKLAWSEWRKQLTALGYKHRVVSLNAMHAQTYGPPAPQSRDRIYIVCWLTSHRAPDVDKILRPRAFCPKCDVIVEATQAWKNRKTVGRYRQTYVYLHGACGTVVEPGWLPASTAIDWSIPGEPIGDRLKPKTRARIAAGIARYWGPFHLEAAGNTYDAADPNHAQHGNPDAYYRAWPTDETLRALTTTNTRALAVPVEGRDEKQAAALNTPLRTMTTRLETGLATPPNPFILERRGEYRTRSIDAPISTLTANDTTKAVIAPSFVAELRGGASDARPASDPASTFTAGGNHHALVTSAGGTWNDDARTVNDPLRTLTTRDANALVTPYYSASEAAKSVDVPIGTLTTVDRYALVHRNNTGGAEMTTPITEPIRTLTAAGHQSLIQAGQRGGRPKVSPADLKSAEDLVSDCLFRMFQPHEVAAGMAFPRDYIWQPDPVKKISNRRLVRAAGNAVCPPCARDLMAVVVESFGSAA